MANTNYSVQIGWEPDTDFEGLYDDITDDVKSIHFARGKSDELGKAEVGSCSIVVNNADKKYTPSYASSVLYGDLLPKRPVRIRAVQQLVSVSVTKALVAASNYAAEDVLSESASAGTKWTFSDITKIKGGFGYITKARALCETTGLIPRLTLYLYKETPTCNLNDNVANTSVLHVDLENYLGKIDFPVMEDMGGDSETLASPGTYGNLPLAFDCAHDSTSIYGVLVTRDAITTEVAGDDMTIVLTIELPQYDLFYGFIEEIIPHPHLSEQDCVITAVDGFDFLSRHDLNTTLYTDIKTGLAHQYILDDALWNQDMRLLDEGQDTIPYWYGHNLIARNAQCDLDDSEQGFSFIDGAGHFRFEDRYHRSRITHQTSQGEFDNTMAYMTYSLNPRHIYNIIKVTVTPFELHEEAKTFTARVSLYNNSGLSTYLARLDEFNFQNSDGAWLTPVNSIDADAAWTSDTYAYDGLTSTYTYSTVPTSSWSSYIQFLLSAEEDIKAVRFFLDTLQSVNITQIKIDLYIDSSWVNIYTGVFTLNEWNTVTLSGFGATELWRLQDTPSISAGETSTWWGEASYGGNSVFVGTWTTPVSTTDYTANSQADGLGTDMTSDLAITTTKFAQTIKLAVTNNGTVPAYITLLKARGTWYDDQTKVTRKAEDSDSQAAYQKRTLTIDGKYMDDADQAQDLVDYSIGKYKNPRAELSMSVINKSDAVLTQILSREISDRITVDNDNLGIDGDFFIDYMEHDISEGGLLHTVTYRLADCLSEDFWCLDFSALASSSLEGQTKLGY